MAQSVPDRVVQHLQNWMAEEEVIAAQLAVAYRGDVRRHVGIGLAPGPVDLASLSKAITASCAADLVAAGVLEWDAPVGRYRPDIIGPLGRVSLSELVTHTGGLWPDTTQGPMAAWRGAGAPVHGLVTQLISRRELDDRIHLYNNENYAVLAEVIETTTRQDFATYCTERVLAPLGLETAEASPRFGRFAAWGGWRMALDDYARFVWARFGQRAPAAGPTAEIGGGASYGLGMAWRPFSGRANQWHFGALCFADGPNLFTYSVLFSNGWGVVIYVENCPESDWFIGLDAAIVDAVFQ